MTLIISRMWWNLQKAQDNGLINKKYVQWRIQEFVKRGAQNHPLPSPPIRPPPLPSPPLTLEVGPLNPARGSGGAL